MTGKVLRVYQCQFKIETNQTRTAFTLIVILERKKEERKERKRKDPIQLPLPTRKKNKKRKEEKIPTVITKISSKITREGGDTFTAIIKEKKETRTK